MESRPPRFQEGDIGGDQKREARSRFASESAQDKSVPVRGGSDADKNPPETLVEFMTQSDKYADAEETRNLREAVQNAKTTAKGSAKNEVNSAGGNKRKDERARDERRSGKRPNRMFSTYISLNKPREQVLMEIKSERFEEIERLIREGRLKEHVERTGTTEERPSDDRPTEEIRTIVRGPLCGNDSNNAQKNHARSLNRPESDTLIIARPSKEKKKERYCISFTDEDARGIYHPHDDALVITLIIANRRVFHILVDTESSADMLFTQAFDRMTVERSTLRPVRTPLVRFSGGQILPEEIISLSLTAGNHPHQATTMVDFLIVDQSSVYNAILGRPSLSVLQAVVSTYHLSMKFSTELGVVVVKRDQQDARRCYMTAVKRPTEKAPTEVSTIESLDPRVETHERGQPVEDLVSVPLVETDKSKTMQVGSSLRPPLRDNLIALLR
ncbi:uncharacterized protein LOC131246909 [Magnolia sinica]|uniref:uncharacterized protein LOC131246909 n=1 Tax=Magnolia sinica TaxID=86752 RepID=UPI002658BBD2|nr:uncharacterized protein LOC131246909 [Magnolia sinica]